MVASALGIPTLLPFLKAVCQSKKSWQARHTGIKIVQQIAILMGCAVLPHLKSLVDIIKHGGCDGGGPGVLAACLSASPSLLLWPVRLRLKQELRLQQQRRRRNTAGSGNARQIMPT